MKLNYASQPLARPAPSFWRGRLTVAVLLLLSALAAGLGVWALLVTGVVRI